jgi:Flp pilus assembly protein TadG
MLVEAAVIFPVFLVILIGVFSFGLVYYNQLTLTQAVGAGAQYVQMYAPYTTDPCSDALTTIEAAAPSLAASSITLTLTINNGTPSSGVTTCPGQATNMATAIGSTGASGFPVTVKATYPCNFKLLSAAFNLLKQTFSSTCSLSAQATEYVTGTSSATN